MLQSTVCMGIVCTTYVQGFKSYVPLNPRIAICSTFLVHKFLVILQKNPDTHQKQQTLLQLRT